VLEINYCATEQLLQLATLRLPLLRAFTHVSSAWAYASEPAGSTLYEEVTGLVLPSGRQVQHAQLAGQLLEPGGDRLALELVQHWGFPDAYCLSKRLSELLVLDYSQRLGGCGGCCFALVRPSLIGAVAARPYPGYCLGNVRGATGEPSC
jgi:hypothetical protein